VSAAAGRDAWLEDFASGPLTDPLPEVDWAQEALLLAVVECTNTDKELQFTAVESNPSGLLVEVQLRHPGIDGAIETTYWTAASVPGEYAGSAVSVNLTEVFEPEPQ
jgi:hypothetical protein